MAEDDRPLPTPPRTRFGRQIRGEGPLAGSAPGDAPGFAPTAAAGVQHPQPAATMP